MTELACAWVRDRLPPRSRDGLDVADAARLEQHLAACADCRAEATLVSALAVPVAVPPELEAHVLRAVRKQPAVANGAGGVRHYALAASFVFALLTGSLLWQQFGARPSPATIDGAVEAVLALPVGADALLHESGLQSLSEDELRTLLEELGS
jgi:hypothetical protein